MDVEHLVQILKEVNIAQIFVMFVGMWFFYSRLNNKIDKLAEKTEDIDRRLCRIEGSLSNHGHCLFTKSQSDHKAL